MSTIKDNNKDQQSNTSSAASDSQSKILKNLSRKLTDDYFNQKNFPRRTAANNDGIQVDSINRYIKKTANKISGSVEEYDDTSSYPSDKVENFNGTDPNEQKTLLIEQIKHLERENLKLKHQLDLLTTDYQTEKRQLSNDVRELKNELHRTAPLTGNQFFTFSKDLREVVKAVKSLSDEEMVKEDENQDEESSLEASSLFPSTITIESPQLNPYQNPTQSPKIIKKQEKADDNHEEKPEKSFSFPESKKTNKKTKKIMATVTIVAVIIFSSATLFFSQQTKVDQSIVDAHLDENGSVQGAADQNGNNPEATPSMVRKEQKNNQASFEDTQWEVLRDEFLGFQVKYPGNVTDLLHTGNTITFLRKEGYLFKMQRIKTDKTLEEYWEETKANGLNYKAEEGLIDITKVLHLTLQEDVEFPGNRYLAKVNGHIFDIWYATPNEKFDDDDMKRVDYMLNTIRFL